MQGTEAGADHQLTNPHPVGSTDWVQDQLALIARAFSPSAPVTERSLFSGRQDQLWRLVDVTQQRGQHAIVYGDRGVGKTSLARVAPQIGQQAALHAYYTCSSDDTFSSIWWEVLEEIVLQEQLAPVGFADDGGSRPISATQLLGAQSPDQTALSPSNVRRALTALGRQIHVVVTIDEFDRVSDSATRTLLADTIKALSDASANVTIVLVGVGKTVEELLAEHASVVRSLVQVHMPPMTEQELKGIVDSGMKAAGMAVEEEFTRPLVRLSLGLPHYTHLVAQHGARLAAESGRLQVFADDFSEALDRAMHDVSRSVLEAYHRATGSNRETLYRPVLLACALAPKDGLGQFGTPEVRDQLKNLIGETKEVSAFAAHLNDFSGQDRRGQILRKIGEKGRRQRYQFVDPMMPSYVLMRGFRDGDITFQQLMSATVGVGRHS